MGKNKTAVTKKKKREGEKGKGPQGFNYVKKVCLLRGEGVYSLGQNAPISE